MNIVFQTDGDVKSPLRAHDSDSGFDLFSPYEFTLKPDERATIPMGVKFEIKTPAFIKLLKFLGVPLLVEGQVRPKSGRSKAGYEVSLGTVDNQYRGGVGVTIHNYSKKKIKFAKDEKLAQIVFALVFSSSKFGLIPGEVSESTERGQKGFGSSGVK